MKLKYLLRHFVFLLLLAQLIFPASLLAQNTPPPQDPAQQTQKKEYLTVQELIKSKAGQLFVTRRFAEALEEFKLLSRQYPKDIVIKRYIGACLDHLRRDEEAVTAFEEVLKVFPQDLVSRQFVAKIHLRMGQLDKAEQEFNYIIQNDKAGTFTAYAKAQLETIKKLRETEKAIVQAPGVAITPQQFIQTDAAKAFMNAKYDQALEGLRDLEKKYPNDVLIKRYRGLTLDRMKRFDDAVKAYEAGLQIAPESISLHYFLAQSYLHKKDLEAAKREFSFVVQKDTTKTYQIKAQQELIAVQTLQALLKQLEPKKWSVNASGGGEWSKNPTSYTRLPHLRTHRAPSAWKFSNSFGGSYEFWKKGKLTGSASYSSSNAWYESSLQNLDTFANTLSVTFSYATSFLGKPLTLQLGESTAHTFLYIKFYNVAFTPSLTAIYSPVDWDRITLSEKLAFSDYDDRGSSPDFTSRNGFGNTFSATNNFYLTPQKNTYLATTFEHAHEFPQGNNNKRDNYSLKNALHFPVILKVEADFYIKFKNSQFPKYGFPRTSPGRQDNEYSLGTTLSRPIGKRFTLSGSYTYTNTISEDNNFTYLNHTLGMNLSYNY